MLPNRHSRSLPSATTTFRKSSTFPTIVNIPTSFLDLILDNNLYDNVSPTANLSIDHNHSFSHQLDRSVSLEGPSDPAATTFPNTPTTPPVPLSAPPSDGTSARRNDSLSFYYQNVRGLRTKSKKFYLSVLACDYDIIALTETWLNLSHHSEEYFSSDYIVHRRDRTTNSNSNERGGSVLVAVREGLTSEQIEIMNCDNSIEYVCVKIKSNNIFIFMYCLYIPPDSTVDIYNAHADAIGKIEHRTEDLIYVLGDFNLPGIRWIHEEDDDCHFIPTNVRTDTQAIITNLFNAGFRQVVGYTNTAGNALDLLFVNDTDNLCVNKANQAISKVDVYHEPFEFFLDVVDCNRYSSFESDNRYNFRRADFDDLNAYLASHDFSSLFLDHDIDVCVDILDRILDDGFNRFVPKSPTCLRKRLPWYTRELVGLKNRKSKAFKRYSQSHSEADYEKYRLLRSEFNILQSYLYDNYISSVQENLVTDPSSFWNYVNLKKRTNGYPKAMTYENAGSSDGPGICNLFADFFESNYSPSNDNFEFDRDGTFERHPSLTGMGSVDTSLGVVLEALQNVDASKGPGPDGISPLFLKNCASSLAEPLHLIFTKSLMAGIFPSNWKTSSLTAIFKSGSRSRIENYRGIAMLPSIAKLFESIVCKSLADYVQPLLSPQQHGFSPNRSCSTNLLEFTNFTLTSMEAGHQVDALFTDFEKAFDRVPHDILIMKLAKLGIHSSLLRWIWSYLRDRKQFVKMGFAKSRLFVATSGVPQGSHIGPLLFLAFINDIVSVLQPVGHLLFADDLKIFSRIRGLADAALFQNTIDQLVGWCEENRLFFNIGKCKVVTFGRLRNPLIVNYTMSDTCLQRDIEVRDLGVHFDCKMSFVKHINVVVAKSYSMLGFIKRMCSNMDCPYALKSLYCAFVRSKLEYAAIVWQPHYRIHSNRIESIQKQFVLYALRKLGWTDRFALPPYLDRLQLINLESLARRRFNSSVFFVFDLLHGFANAPNLKSLLRHYNSTRNLRSAYILRPEIRRTNYGLYEPINHMSRLFNRALPFYIASCSRDNFRLRVRSCSYQNWPSSSSSSSTGGPPSYRWRQRGAPNRLSLLLL